MTQHHLDNAILFLLLILLCIDKFWRATAVKVALFANDVTLISSRHNKLVAEKKLQRAVTAVAKRSTSKEMVFNADKCEVIFFCTNSHEMNWQPTTIATAMAFFITRNRKSSESHRADC